MTDFLSTSAGEGYHFSMRTKVSINPRIIQGLKYSLIGTVFGFILGRFMLPDQPAPTPPRLHLTTEQLQQLADHAAQTANRFKRDLVDVSILGSGPSVSPFGGEWAIATDFVDQSIRAGDETLAVTAGLYKFNMEAPHVSTIFPLDDATIQIHRDSSWHVLDCTRFESADDPVKRHDAIRESIEQTEASWAAFQDQFFVPDPHIFFTGLEVRLHLDHLKAIERDLLYEKRSWRGTLLVD